MVYQTSWLHGGSKRNVVQPEGIVLKSDFLKSLVCVEESLNTGFLNLCQTEQRSANSVLVTQGILMNIPFPDLSGDNRYPSFYRQDLSLVAFTDNALQFVPQLIPVPFKISDLFLSPVLIAFQIFISLDPVFSEKPGLGVQFVQFPDILPHKVRYLFYGSRKTDDDMKFIAVKVVEPGQSACFALRRVRRTVLPDRIHRFLRERILSSDVLQYPVGYLIQGIIFSEPIKSEETFRVFRTERRPLKFFAGCGKKLQFIAHILQGVVSAGAVSVVIVSLLPLTLKFMPVTLAVKAAFSSSYGMRDLCLKDTDVSADPVAQ